MEVSWNDLKIVVVFSMSAARILEAHGKPDKQGGRGFVGFWCDRPSSNRPSSGPMFMDDSCTSVDFNLFAIFATKTAVEKVSNKDGFVPIIQCRDEMAKL